MDERHRSEQEQAAGREWFDRYCDKLDRGSVVRPKSDSKYACPCCGNRTLTERGGFEICKVCFWEDDGQDDHDADEVRGGPNGALSLSAARRNYRTSGASDPKFLSHVRPPTPDETHG
jgi:hypothetical protein